MSQSSISNGNPVIFRRDRGFRAEDFGLENDRIYRVADVEIVPKKTLLPASYIAAGFIPSCYAPHMSRGITTTNHDMMGSDRFIVVEGRKFSATHFRLATRSEVNQNAKSIL